MKSSESIPRRSTDVIGEECVGILLEVWSFGSITGWYHRL